MAESSFFIEVTPKSWKEAKEIAKEIETFNLYRGHSDNTWRLESSLFRSASRFLLPTKDIRKREQTIIKLFKSRAHHYIQSPPNESEILEWVSLIQHHGGPTRLLDFTQSFYIASFFALEAATNTACVWAVDEGRLILAIFHDANRRTQADIKLDIEYFNPIEKITRFAEEFIKDTTKKDDLIIKVVPTRLNERLAVQKGIFLLSCNIEERFEKVLCKSLKFPFESLESKNAEQLNARQFLHMYGDKNGKRQKPLTAPIIKINLPIKLRAEAIADLHLMNIDYASLFPGLDGFAKSLNYHLTRTGKSIYSFIVTESDPEERLKDI